MQREKQEKVSYSYIDESSSSDEVPRVPVFGGAFDVDPLPKPDIYLPQYQANQRHYEPTANQQCRSSCGRCCMCMACPYGLCGCTGCSCIYLLPTSKAGLVEEFGKFSRLLKPGFNMINPCSEEVETVDLRLRVMNVGRHQIMTKDNVKADVDASVSFRVTNPIVSQYKYGRNLNRALIELTISSLRDTAGQYALQSVLIQRLQIAHRAKEMVSEGIHEGIRVENIFIDQIIIPPEILRDLTSAARQKRLSQAKIIQNRADVQTADLMRESAQLMATKAAMQIRYLEMVQKLGEDGVLLIMDIGIDKKGFKQ